MIFTRVKRFVLGEPLSANETPDERIPVWKGLAVLSSDALSSVAYATEEIIVPLAAVGAAAMAWSMPIALTIALLLVVVTLSYRQTLDAYPTGSGAYLVAQENLGVTAGLVAGAALLIDYVLTVSVSVAAGVQSILSAVPALSNHRVALGALVILLLTLAKLRGGRGESAAFSWVPTYAFIVSILALTVLGSYRLLTGTGAGEGPERVAELLAPRYPAIPIFLILTAFSHGCAALTGVEAISDNVTVFKPPQQKNARRTLTWMAFILGAMFLAVTVLAHGYAIRPVAGQTTLSVLAHRVFDGHAGGRALYLFFQASTASILFLAANTSYWDFPRLASSLAKDRFLPRQMASLGDRLVFSNGVIWLSAAAIGLVIFSGGETHRLIPLYALGVFISFTLSQAGMVLRHLRKRGEGWLRSLVFNLAGAVTTFLVLLVIAVTKFVEGAWIIFLMIPLLVLLFTRINRHYLSVGKELTLTGAEPAPRLEPVKHTAIIPVSGIHRGVIDAIRYAMSIAQDVRAVYIELDPEASQRMKAEWQQWVPEIPFVILKSPYRSVIAPLLDYIDDVGETTNDEMITVIIPEFITAKWRHQFLHNQTALLIRAALLFRRGKVVTSVRYFLRNT